MRVLHEWLAEPLDELVRETGARFALVTSTFGQVIGQHGFTRSLDVMAAASLAAGIVATTREVGAMVGSPGGFGAIAHQGAGHGIWLEPISSPHGDWILLVAFGEESTVGLVRLFSERFVRDISDLVPLADASRELLAEGFERELDASLRALFEGA